MRFYFHIRDYVHVDDPEGRELPDEAAAREHALEAARELVCAGILDRQGVNLDHRVEVATEAGQVLFSVTFREAFTVTG